MSDVAFADEFIAEQTREIRRLTDRSGQDIIDIGQRLNAVKERLPHGEFGPWIDREFGWTWQTANNFMRVARAFVDIENGFQFEAKALYALASGDIPEATRQQFIDQAQAGQPVRHRDVKAALPRNTTPDTLVTVDLETGEIVDPAELDDDEPTPLASPPRPTAERPLTREELPAYVASVDPQYLRALDEQTAAADELPLLIARLGDLNFAVKKADVAFGEIRDEVLQRHQSNPDVRAAFGRAAERLSAMAIRCRAISGERGEIRRVI